MAGAVRRYATVPDACMRSDGAGLSVATVCRDRSSA
jgi:hypothetical protein